MFDAKATAILLNAFASVDNACDVGRVLLSRLRPCEWTFARDISMALNALAQMGWQASENDAVQRLCDAFMKVKWTSRDLANVLEAITRMDFVHDEMIAEVRSYIPANVAAFRYPRDVTALFLAFGRQRVRDAPLFIALSHAVERHLDEYSLQQLAHIVTSFARLEIRNTHFLQLLSEYLCDQKVGPIEAVTFLSSLGRLQIAHPKMMDHLGSSLAFPLSPSDSKEVAVSFSRAPRYHNCLVRLADEFPAMNVDIVEVYRAFARLRLRHENVRRNAWAVLDPTSDKQFIQLAYSELQLYGRLSALWPRRRGLQLEKGVRLLAFTTSLAAITFGAPDKVGALWWMREAVEDVNGMQLRVDRLDRCVWSHVALWNSLASDWAANLSMNTLLALELVLMDAPKPKRDGWKLTAEAIGVHKECKKLGYICDTNMFFGSALRTDIVLAA
eukprot:GEMP01050712.1.p1 GENE.GEMP01050712.1~~GEMP01050712.1.p1  ORF type:complete len:444 (+),score=93.00 GEMP01050712.1:164-1495(+)